MQIPNVSEEDVQWADALLSAGGGQVETDTLGQTDRLTNRQTD